jgi:hypothetical protein
VAGTKELATAKHIRMAPRPAAPGCGGGRPLRNICLRGRHGLETIVRMSPLTQLRIAATLNLAASCTGAIFFVFNLYRLISHQAGSRQSMTAAFLILYAFGAYFFWGRYRLVSSQLSKINRTSK